MTKARFALMAGLLAILMVGGGGGGFVDLRFHTVIVAVNGSSETVTVVPGGNVDGPSADGLLEIRRWIDVPPGKRRTFKRTRPLG